MADLRSHQSPVSGASTKLAGFVQGKAVADLQFRLDIQRSGKTSDLLLRHSCHTGLRFENNNEKGKIGKPSDIGSVLNLSRKTTFR